MANKPIEHGLEEALADTVGLRVELRKPPPLSSDSGIGALLGRARHLGLRPVDCPGVRQEHEPTGVSR